MIKRKYNRLQQSEKKTYPIKRRLLWIVLVLVLCCILFELSFRNQMANVIEHQANIIATEVMTEAIQTALAKTDMSYDKISKIKTDAEGNIIAIETDMVTINQLKATIMSDVTKRLKQIRFQKYNISLGSLLGSEYFVGRGPEITLKIEPTGYLKAEFINNFSSAGINQTQHKIMLNMEVAINTYVPLHRTITKVKTDIIVAETIVVGKVPQYYTNVISDDKSLISDLNDYNTTQYPN